MGPLGKVKRLFITPDELEKVYPNLAGTVYAITSIETTSYNCAAWAAEDITRGWWPWSSYYWPAGIPLLETIPAFLQAFATLGYEPCQDGRLETGFEKIAIYADDSRVPSHIARQLDDGQWTSKLGDWEDIRHTLRALEGPPNQYAVPYGTVKQFMRRPR